MLIYPAIDLKDGGCVRLLHGRFDAVTRYDEDPFARLKAFAEAGAEWVHIVDLDGAKARMPVQHALIGQLAATGAAKIQTGGGVRTLDDVRKLLSAGAARVVVGSIAAQEPDAVRSWVDAVGPERITLALDVKIAGDGEPEVAVHGWTEGSGRSLWDVLDAYPEGSARHLLATDVGRDGALTGVNIQLVAEIVRRRPDLAVQASGGVATLEDLRVSARAGAAGAIVGRALYEGKFTLQEALAAVTDAG